MLIARVDDESVQPTDFTVDRMDLFAAPDLHLALRHAIFDDRRRESALGSAVIRKSESVVRPCIASSGP